MILYCMHYHALHEVICLCCQHHMNCHGIGDRQVVIIQQNYDCIVTITAVTMSCAYMSYYVIVTVVEQ